MERLQHILKPTDGQYDVVAMLSGGKDSVLMLHDLVATHPGLRVLCVTYDDGFLGEHARRNVGVVCKHFHFDNLWIRFDCTAGVEAYVESALPQSVDIYTYLEVFQNVFWEKIRDIALSLGDLPVITGNIGYFSSECLLPEQYQSCVDFMAGRGFQVTPVNVTFVSYWAEETFPTDLSILKEIGWESSAGNNTDSLYINAVRARVNSEYPKKTLDDVVEEKWDELVRPRFSMTQGELP